MKASDYSPRTSSLLSGDNAWKFLMRGLHAPLAGPKFFICHPFRDFRREENLPPIDIPSLVHRNALFRGMQGCSFDASCLSCIFQAGANHQLCKTQSSIRLNCRHPCDIECLIDGDGEGA
jgi:hypothetical protein